jgi:uroporphyrinogen-III synthase
LIPLIILRPEPGAAATALRANGLGLPTRCFPLYAARPIPWDCPDVDSFDTILMTSANAARLGGPQLRCLISKPVVAVGAQSALAVRAAGFTDMTVGDNDARTAMTLTSGRVLHLAGHDHVAVGAAQTRHVYRVEALEPAADFQEVLGKPAILLVHSPRAAERINCLCAGERGHLYLIAISQNAARAAREGWAGVRIADQPSDASMLALAQDLWQHLSP